MNYKIILTAAVALLATLGLQAKKAPKTVEPQSPTAVSFTRLLWEGEAPHPKVIRPDANGNVRAGVDVGDTAKIHVFLPPAEKANGKALVLCPGGGYSGLCMGYEGVDWAPFFNDLGIALVVLQYRLPEGTWQIPVEDVQEAIRLCRRNAQEWNLDVNKIGVGGSSAGGHLASTASTHFDNPVNPDSVSCRPDFSVLYYPVISMMPELSHTGTRLSLLGPAFPLHHEVLFSNDRQVTDRTPRAWLAYADDDKAVPPVNGTRYYEALKAHNIPAAMHIYPSGGHGWGYLPQFAYRNEMLADLAAWLKSF